MKKLLLSLIVLLALTQTKAQLTDWQKQHNKQIMFYDNWLQSRLNEGDADASQEIELGNDFWFRAYMDDNSIPKTRGNKIDLRISCEGVSVTLNDMYNYAKTNFYSSNGILPNYDQIQIPGVDNFWWNKNVFSSCGFNTNGEFDKFTNYGCTNNGFAAESLLRFLLSKIDNKVVAGAVLNVKFELVYRTAGEYRMPGGTYETLAEGTVKLKVPAKDKALAGHIYRLVERPGMADKALEESIKNGILTQAQTVIADVIKIQVISNAYKIDKNSQGVPLNRWVKARVIYKAKSTGETFTGFVNAVFNYDGTNFDSNVSKLFFQCGNTFAPSYAVK